MMLNPAELSLIDRWQRNFPLVERPFAVVGRSVGLDEGKTIETFHRLCAADVISRIGAVDKPHTVGASTLGVMQVPPERLEQVAGFVSREPLVTHNYERAHALNLWFVIVGARPDLITATIQRIEERTGLDVLDFPLLKAYHLDLGFPLSGARPERCPTASPVGDYRPDKLDRGILIAIENGLPLVEMPYRTIAEHLGLDQANVIDRLDRLAASGIVTRFGCVVRHRTLGYTANAMAVWEVPGDKIDAVAATFVRNPGVTLCYRRPQRLPIWPYNLFCMVHAKSQRDAYAVIDDINLRANTGLNNQAVLFSARCFKQRGAVFSASKQRLN